MEDIRNSLNNFQLILKIYMALTGSIDNLGAISIVLVGVLDDICLGRYTEAATSLDSIGLRIMNLLVVSAIERTTGTKTQIDDDDLKGYAEQLFDNLSDLGIAEEILPYITELVNVKAAD
jgi:hypothetical protein